jgi:acyl-CoA synthetase (AMP-forming)/AMP-acid ligase II
MRDKVIAVYAGRRTSTETGAAAVPIDQTAASPFDRAGAPLRATKGILHLVDRSRETFFRFGFAVDPGEIEAVLDSHPRVARSAVLGFMRDGEEDIAAFVEIRRGARLEKRELAEYSARLLAPCKRPSTYFFVDALPLTPSGKVLKDALAAQLAEAG